MGFLPVIMPIVNRKTYELKERKFICFLVLTTMLIAIEASIIVFIPEEGGKLFPGKVCYRYLAVLTIPYILMFLKCDKKYMKMNISLYIIYIVIGMYVVIYHIVAERTISVIDGYFLVMLEFLDSFWRPSSITIIFSMIIFVLIFIDMIGKGKIKNLSKTYMKIFIISLIVILPINLYIPIHASNIKRKGTELEKDYIKIAKYLNLDYDKVYGYNLPDYNFFCQVISDYRKIEKAEDINIDVNNQSIAVMVCKDFDGTIIGAKKTDIDTKYIDIYVNENNVKELQIKYCK